MAAERGQEVTSSSIHDPQHIIFTATQDCVALRMPLAEQNVILLSGPIFKFAFELEGNLVHIVALKLPDLEDIVHSSGHAQLAIEIELDEFDCLRVAFELAGFNAIIALLVL